MNKDTFIEFHEDLSEICRTVCVYRFHLRCLDHVAHTEPTAVTSGPARDAHDLGASLRRLRKRLSPVVRSLRGHLAAPQAEIDIDRQTRYIIGV